MKALTFSRFGGPDVLQYIDVAEPVLQEGEVLVETKAIGLNYADVYRRQGNYHLLGEPPFIAGYEGAGVVVNGNGVDGVNNSDRVCFADVPFANAEYVKVPFDHLIPLPDEISFEQAATVLLQGLTAQYLTQDSYAVSGIDTVLVHACAGGVGSLLVQLAKSNGAKVTGLTSSEEKREAALKNGCDNVFLYNQDWVEACKRAGITVVYESVGTTLLQSFEAVQTKGTVVFYGFAGGNPPPVDARMLMDGSKRLIGGDLWNYLVSAEERRLRSKQLFTWILSGKVRVAEPARFALADGAKAHAFLESRKSTGKIILLP